MKFWILIIMGLLYGLTGFLPVSSSGHFSVLKHTLGWNLLPEIRVIMDISTVILIIYVFHRDMSRIAKEIFGMLGRFIKNTGIFFMNIRIKDKKEYLKIMNNPYDHYALFLILAMIPEVVLTVFLQPIAKVADLSLLIPGLCLLINGVVLLIADNMNPGYRTTVEINAYTGVLIGMVQGLACLSGFSYLSVAFTMALLFGYQKEFAVRTSFFMMIPAMIADAVYHIFEINQVPEFLTLGKSLLMVVIMVAALLVVGNICIRATLLIVKKKKFWMFAVENLILGAFALVWHFLF